MCVRRSPCTVVDADEMQQLRRAARLAKEEQEASNEVRALRERIEKLERLLIQADEEFHSPQITALRMVDRGPVRKD